MIRVSIIAACITIAGCASPVPVAENFPLMHQRLARTAKHWDVVAMDVVQQTSAALQANPTLSGRPVLIGNDRSTAFNAAFRNFLTNHMVQTGLPVNVCPAASKPGFQMDAQAVEVHYEVQLVQHSARMPLYRPGALTALAAGVIVGRSLAVSHFDSTEASVIGLGLAALMDVGAGHLAQPTRAEIIITTTIAQENRFMFRRSDVYYVPEADAALFVSYYQARSFCPQTASTVPPRTDSDARDEMLAAAQRRSNPQWRPAGPFWRP